jgi:hypothetical protein
MTLNLGIGYCTPPLGVSLYISGAVADRDLLYVARAVMPTLLIQIGLLLLLTFWPDLVLWLPRLVYRRNPRCAVRLGGQLRAAQSQVPGPALLSRAHNRP